MTDKFKPVPNIPKTYEQFVLEDKQLTLEQQQDLYPDLVHEGIGRRESYGPCGRSDCGCRSGEVFTRLYTVCPATECPNATIPRYPTY